MSEEDHFLARWARRKADVAASEVAAAEETARQPASVETIPQGTAATPTTEDPFDLAALPSLDDITSQTDIRPFMHRLVPANLRNAALRRMWEADTSIRDYVSPATEYAWDFNVAGSAPGYGPLEAGYDAAKAAARMFSGKFDDPTLVEEDPSCEDPVALALAREAAPLPAIAAPSDSMKVEIQTVRLSTNSGHDPRPPVPTALPQDSGEEPESDEKPPATQQFRLRHGGAMPK